MKFPLFFLAIALLAVPVLHASDADPLAAYLDGKPPEILRELAVPDSIPPGIRVQRVVFRSRDDSEIFALIATPVSEGKHPGILVLHGGGGSAEVDKAMAWAQRGYVAVAPDLPGIAEPKKLVDTKGKWSSLAYGEGRWIADPDASVSVIFDAVLAAMKSLYLLEAQPSVDRSRIGVVGISWGGYMTAMVCSLAGEQVRAGFALYGCGSFQLSGEAPTEPLRPGLPRNSFWRMPDAERARWQACLDPGFRAPSMKSAYFLAAATNDFFGWPRSAAATLKAVPGEKNHLFAPNANHKMPVPGGGDFKDQPDPNFTPTPFQPYPTPKGAKANWVAMEVPYFDYYLKGEGKPFPKATAVVGSDPALAKVRVDAPVPVSKVEIYWATPVADPPKRDDVAKRQWNALPAESRGGGIYEAKLPAEAGEWFGLVSDERPVTVSTDMIRVAQVSGTNQTSN